MDSPYHSQPSVAFWSRAPRSLDGIWTPKFAIDRRSDRIMAAGSCFSNHIGRFLLQEGFAWLSDDGASRQPGNYASFDLGNVYTARQLLFWLEAALSPDRVPVEEGIWVDPVSGVATDLLRLGIANPEFATVDDLVRARYRACEAIRDLLGRATVLCFTLGLTEGWETPSGVPYPICPAVRVAGLDPSSYRLVNQDHDAVWADLERVVGLLSSVSPDLRLILTVSPVPLAATATDRHVVPATVYSKSVLRAVAERAARAWSHVDYFPSYELITSQLHGRDFFEANRRQVSAEGVAFVMRHFLAGIAGSRPLEPADDGMFQLMSAGDNVCEEELYDVDRSSIPAGAVNVLLLGSSQMRELGKKLALPHRIFTMNGDDFIHHQFEVDPRIIFRPKPQVFRDMWEEFLQGFDLGDLKAGNWTVVTDIGCHSFKWDIEIPLIATTFAAEASKDLSDYSPTQLRVALELRRAPHLKLLQTLVAYGNRVIWVTDPPCIPQNLEAAEIVMARQVKLAGVQDILRSRRFFGPSEDISGPDAIHGSDHYYEVVARQVRKVIETRARSSASSSEEAGRPTRASRRMTDGD